MVIQSDIYRRLSLFFQTEFRNKYIRTHIQAYSIPGLTCINLQSFDEHFFAYLSYSAR